MKLYLSCSVLQYFDQVLFIFCRWEIFCEYRRVHLLKFEGNNNRLGKESAAVKLDYRCSFTLALGEEDEAKGNES